MQVIFSSADESVVRVLSRRGVENVDRVLLFDIWYYDEAKRDLQEKKTEEVLKYLDALKLKYSLAHLDVSQPFHAVVIEIARRTECRKGEAYLTGRDTTANLALYYFSLICGKIKVFDGEGREIPNKVPERVSEAQLEVLSLLREEKEVQKLAEEMGKSLSTLSKQISELEEKGLVTCSSTRPKKCRATEAGLILLAVRG